MKVSIANGSHEADYIIKMFNCRKNEVIVINSDPSLCSYLSASNKIQVINGNPTKRFDLSLAKIDSSDIFIALSNDDIENYVACKMAKRLFDVNKTIAVVRNPKNVDTFKKLGVDAVICGTYLLAESIKSESSFEELIKTLSLEENRILISEILIKEGDYISGKTLCDVHFPLMANISCIFRNPNVIIPNGKTTIKAKDKILVVTTPNNQKAIEAFIHKGK